MKDRAVCGELDVVFLILLFAAYGTACLIFLLQSWRECRAISSFLFCLYNVL